MIYRNGSQRIDYGPGPVGRLSMPGRISGIGGALVSHVAARELSPTEQKRQRRAAAKRAWRAAHR